MGNAAMVTTILLSLCVLTYIKKRYCSDPFCKCRRFSFFFSIRGIKLEGDSIRMQPRRHQSLDLVEIDDDYDNTRYKLDGPVGEEDFNTTRPTCYNTSKRSERCATVGDIHMDGNHSLIYAIPLARQWKTKRYALRHRGRHSHGWQPPLCPMPILALHRTLRHASCPHVVSLGQ
jgi:hypothetical protein